MTSSLEYVLELYHVVLGHEEAKLVMRPVSSLARILRALHIIHSAETS